MADINCAVCGEPWDAYGVRWGDMEKWEAELFKKGAGCPCCHGVRPEGFSEEEAMEARCSSLMDGTDEDPISWGWEKPDIEWKQPEPKVIWTCAGCEVSVVESVVEWDKIEWHGGKRVHYYEGVAFSFTEYPHGYHGEPEPPKESALIVSGKPYCPLCVEYCDECHEVLIFRRQDLETGDSYDDGASFAHPRYFDRSVCVTCFEDLSREEEGDEEEEADGEE